MSAAPNESDRRAEPHLKVAAACGLIGLAVILAYANAWNAPFVLDDKPTILDNRSIRHLGSLGTVLSGGTGTALGRPLLNLSLAVNYALGGMEVQGYHLFNVAVHVLAAWCLFGLLRRTFGLPGMPPAVADSATGLALAVALLWAVHPLQTEAVTYVVQRAESLAGLFYLLTLYCSVRGATAPRPGPWYAAAVTACLLGMATKEVMISAPLLVLLYDRVFLAGSFREAWRRRRPLYLGLAASWLLLAALVLRTGSRGGTAGLAGDVGALDYAATQPGFIVHYLRLCFWPRPLVFDYGPYTPRAPADVWLPALGVLVLAALTLAALCFRPRLGFLAVAFFALLAPSSSVVPVLTQVGAEHRMYLPLAAVFTLAVLLMHRLAGRGWARGGEAAVLVVVAGLLAWQSFERNKDYESAEALWAATVRDCPTNPRAHLNLGVAVALAGRPAEAIPHYQEALRLDPRDARAHNNLGAALAKQGRWAEAVGHYQQALALRPDLADPLVNLGPALAALGRWDEAARQYEEIVELLPRDARARVGLGTALARQGRTGEAVTHFQAALRLNPGNAEAHHALGQALEDLRRPDEALAHFRKAVELNPAERTFRESLERVLSRQGPLTPP